MRSRCIYRSISILETSVTNMSQCANIDDQVEAIVERRWSKHRHLRLKDNYFHNQ